MYDKTPYAGNWTPWIYFDGMIIAADQFSNINFGYIGTYLCMSGVQLFNFATVDDGAEGRLPDQWYLQYGIDMFNQGR